jgi:hypothetical protein
MFFIALDAALIGMSKNSSQASQRGFSKIHGT